jgi:hypothetical protein
MVRLLVAALAVLFSLPAAAQTPGPALPMGMDIRKAPVGAWSEYTVSLAEMPPFKQRFALVSRDAETHSVEMTSEGGSLGAGSKVILKVILEADPAKKDRVRKLVMQLGDNDPMELRQESEHKDQFAPLNPKKLVGKETVKVPAGSFATKHYRDKTAKDGPVVDVYVSDEAPPFGIVKLQGSVSQGPGAPKYPITMELAARGKDAHPAISKPAQPFDQAKLMGQMTRGMGSAPKGK